MHNSEGSYFLQRFALQSLNRKQESLHAIKQVSESPNYAVKITKKPTALDFFALIS